MTRTETGRPRVAVDRHCTRQLRRVHGAGALIVVTITPAASGTVTVDIAAGASQDSAGNPSAAADHFSIVADLTPVHRPTKRARLTTSRR